MKLKKTLNSILAVVLTVCLAAALPACSKKSTSDENTNVYLVYYSNAEASDIIYREYSGILVSSSSYDTIKQLFTQMFDVADDYEGYYSAKPDEVEITDYVIDEDGLLTIDFSREYLSLTNVQEIILRAAVVLTVIQVDGVGAVLFTVEGENALDASGSEIGAMTADTFVNVLLTEEGMLTQETDLTIYFTNEDGSALVPVTAHFSISSNNTSMEEYILQLLIAGPSVDGVYRTLADTVEILGVSTTERICYVNFSSSFLEQTQSVSNEIMVYSIVNSLCRLSYVSSVQFLVEGDSNVTLNSVFDLSQPLQRNRELEQASQ